MADHPNAAKYREVTEAFNTGDMAAMNDYVADDIEWWYIGGEQPARGKQALLGSSSPDDPGSAATRSRPSQSLLHERYALA